MDNVIYLLEKEIKSLETSISNHKTLFKVTKNEERRLLHKDIIDERSKLIDEFRRALKILSNERETVRKHECTQEKCVHKEVAEFHKKVYQCKSCGKLLGEV